MRSFVLKRFSTTLPRASDAWRLSSKVILTLIVASLGFVAPMVAAAQEASSTRTDSNSYFASFPNLIEAITLAKEHAPNVVTARMEVGVANAAYAGARLSALTNPYLEVFVDRGRSGATQDLTVQANLWFPIEMSGQRYRRMAEVDALVAWQKTRMESTQYVAAGEAVRAYGDVLVAAERTRTLTDIVQVAAAEATLYAQRLQAGDATLHDERLAQVELGRTTMLLDESRADFARARMRLTRVTGRRFDAPEPALVLGSASSRAYRRKCGCTRCFDVRSRPCVRARSRLFRSRRGSSDD